MLYIASAQPATCQLDAFRCDFITAGVDCLVINKLTRLEVYTIDVENEQLELKLEIPLHATVAAVTFVKLSVDAASTLMVLTTSMQFFALIYNPTSRDHVDTVSSTSLHEQFGRVSEYQTIAIDHNLRCILVHAYNGLVRVIPLVDVPRKSASGRRGSRSAASSASTSSNQPKLDLSRGYNVRLPMLNLTSLVMLPQSVNSSPEEDQAVESDESGPAVAIVYTNSLGRPALCSHVVDLPEKELGDESDGPLAPIVLDDPGSERVIAVQGPSASQSGVVVIGEESLLWVPMKSTTSVGSPTKKGKAKARAIEQKITARLPVGQIQAFASLAGGRSSASQHFVLGDIYGKLLALNVRRDPNGDVNSLDVRELGDTASPTALVQLSERLLYLASRFGDSQLIRLPPLSAIFPADASSDQPSMELDQAEDLALVHSFSSLAPILDCTVVQGDRGRPSQIVTCSGAYKGGSLRVVRQGVGFAEGANVEIENVQRLWTLQGNASGVSMLVLSFFQDTRLLKLGNDAEDEVEEVELSCFASDQPTLHACVMGNFVVQVTPQSVNFGLRTGGEEAHTWRPEDSKKITLATSHKDTLLVAIEGGKLIMLQHNDGQLKQQSDRQLEAEIACIDVSRVADRLVATVALWTLNTITLLELPSFTPLSTQAITTSFLVRSVLLRTFEDGATILLCGLGDGTVTSFVVDAEEIKILAETQRSAAVGSQPVLLTSHERDRRTSVFVISDRPSIVSRFNDRLVYSSVNLEDVVGVAPFSSSAFPSSLAIATPSSLSIGRIDDIRRVDIQAVPLEDEEPRRIAYNAQNDTFGVVCLRRDVNRETGEQTSTGSIKILENKTFTVLASFPLQPSEEGQSIASVKSGESTYFVVGTALVDPSEAEPTKGRLLVIGEDETPSTWSQLSAAQIGGCPYALASLGNGTHFAAAINSQVTVYSVDAFSQTLTTVSSWGGAFIAFNLSAVGPDKNDILVGDALRSITVLRFKPDFPPSLKDIASDYDAHYMSAVHQMDEDEYIGAETDLNLFTVLKESTGTTQPSLHDETALSPRAAFHLGELVSKFQPGSLAQQQGEAGGIASPRLIYTTSAGSIGVIATLKPEAAKILSDLERNMCSVLDKTGGLSQEEFRAFRSERRRSPAAGFVDGDFVERFAELSEEAMQRVLAGTNEFEKLTVSVVDVLKIVEEAARLH